MALRDANVADNRPGSARTSGVRVGSLIAIAVLGGCLLLAGCKHSGPYLRTSEDRKLYAALPASERAAVDAGDLRAGMTPDLVRLAWGKPADIHRGEGGTPSHLEWIYLGTQWVDRHVWRPSMVDRYGRYWLEPATDRVGIQIQIGHAIFENDRLISWGPTTGRPR